MTNINDREKQVLSIIKNLDISPTMFKQAEEKYKAIASFLNDHGIVADIYPQGSFALGTVVRPILKTNSMHYDLDFICQIEGNADTNTPSSTRKQIIESLQNNEIYKSRMVIYDKCITIQYTDINKIGFSIDIVPATDETDLHKILLKVKSDYPELIDSAIAIPKCTENEKYSWITNNPKGFQDWFSSINKPFLDYSRESYRKTMFLEHSDIFSSIEEIPHELERSSLQRVIQILKCHRDNFYSHFDKGEDIKPISAIITVLTSQIAKDYSPSCSIFELLEHVLIELNTYSEHQSLTDDQFRMKNPNKEIISHIQSKWNISNPANPNDNLADQWNNNSEIPKYFFLWIRAALSDFINLSKNDNIKFRSVLENSFGHNLVNHVLGVESCSNTPRPISKTTIKPYGNK